MRIIKAIRESIDCYPGGLCFATLDGMPILVNQQMNKLISGLMGHTVINAVEVWNELKAAKFHEGAICLENSWLMAKFTNRTEEEQIFVDIDSKIWCFEKQILTTMNPYVVQFSAVEMTELYRLNEELYENNIKLKQMQERQKELLKNIVQVNREKELLETKARIHDELGRCIVATKKTLSEGNIEKDKESLKQGWEDTIRNLSNIPRVNDSTDGAARNELLKVAEMVGCEIQFIGELPEDSKHQQLIFMAVRESLTNAVRHGNANILTVQIEAFASFYTVTITNNGVQLDHPICEGGGLNNLRRRLEQEGALLSIESNPEIKLILTVYKKLV